MTLTSFHTELKRIIQEAGDLLLHYFHAKIFEPEFKKDGSPVTQADLELNRFLKTALLSLKPDAGWLSEEDQDPRSRLHRDWVWVVDPLDGTREFLAGVPEFAISIGLSHHGKAVAGAVLNPATGEGGVCTESGSEFWGFQTKAEAFSQSLLACSVAISRSEARKGAILERLSAFREIRPIGSVAYKLLRLAAGQEHLYFSLEPKSEWDVCGGVALVTSSQKEYILLESASRLFNQADPRIESGAVAGESQRARAFLQLIRNKQ